MGYRLDCLRGLVATAVIDDEDFIGPAAFIQIRKDLLQAEWKALRLVIGRDDDRKGRRLGRAGCHVGTASCRIVRDRSVRRRRMVPHGIGPRRVMQGVEIGC